jgi:hypothetical protein
MNQDAYFKRAEVSNSDIGALKKHFMPRMQIGDIEAAYRFGTLIDAVITEQHKVNHFNYTVEGEQYTAEEFEKAKIMAKAFYTDPFCMNLLNQSDCQKVMAKEMEIEYLGVKFSLLVRCKWDLWMQQMNWGGDIKSTTSTTQKQFEEAIRHFEYDRQRAWYMDIAGSNRDLLIGISKVNYKIFKVPITRGDELYKSGKEKYEEWAFKHWCLFDNF